MIQKIASLSQSIAKLSQQKEFNNALPVLLHILEKQSKNTYKVKIGNLITQTKSQKELIVGARYFANLQKSSVGTLLLSNLNAYPKSLEIFQDAPFKLSFENLKELFSSTDGFLKEWKEFLLDKFIHASDKNDFLFFGNMLLSLQKNVISLIVNQDRKDHILQIKKHEKHNLEFYALYPNLGSLNGVVYKTSDNTLGLNLNTSFENTQTLLKNNLKSLKIFDIMQINLQPNIEPLYAFESSLLDLRG